MQQCMLFVTKTKGNHIARPIYQTHCLPERVRKNYLTGYGKIIVFRMLFFSLRYC